MQLKCKRIVDIAELNPSLILSSYKMNLIYTAKFNLLMIYEFQLWACVLPSDLLVAPAAVSLRQTYQSPYLTKQTDRKSVV